MAECLITTMDNPFNPFTQCYAWYHYDTEVMHYNTWSMLAADYVSSARVDDEIVDKEITNLMDDFVQRNPLGIHVKIYDYEADTLIPLLNKAYKEHLAKLAGDDDSLTPSKST